ncbi:MAG: hypothetical protein AB2A00_07240 [Myxococcota bacterium]
MGTKAEDHVTALENQPRRGKRTQKGRAAARKAAPAARRDVGMARKASYALEASETGRPSRRSTRASANRTKTEGSRRQQQTRELHSPKATNTRTRARRR